MPMIYRRFTEKAAEEWRQIYKALQLLEFLIKHGSERVIDDARGHLTLLKMLRQFQFIDQNGKDQGINVRNRAKELTELLSDVDRIRSERKKARATKNKYTGVEGGVGGGFSSNSRYGGFGSESGYGGGGGGSGGPGTFGGYSGGVYGDGGGFGGQSDDWREASGSRSERFEEYDEFDEDDRPAASSSRSSKKPERAAKKAAPAEPTKPKEPEVDLFSFDEPAQTSSAPAPGASSSGLGGLASTSAANDDDDDFDDFQSAAPAQPTASFGQPLSPPVTSTAGSSTQFAAPTPQSGPQQANISQIVNMASPSGTPGANYSAFKAPAPITSPPQQSTGYQPTGPNYFGGVSTQSTATPSNTASAFSGFSSNTNTGPTTMANTKPVTSPTAAKPPGAAGGDAFGALWGKASSGIKKTNTQTSGGPALGQLAKEKSSAGIWGAPASSTPHQSSSSFGAPQGGSASDDLLG